MKEWFFEIRSGEIPALMQKPISEQLNNILSKILDSYRLTFTHIQTFVSPTRVGACVTGIALSKTESQEERRGPRVDAPQAAIDGFLNSTGAKLEQLEQRQTERGTFYFFTVQHTGSPTIDLLPKILDRIINDCTWPKSMVWNYGTVPWVRPITGGCSVLNGVTVTYEFKLNKSEDSKKIIFDNKTMGHRFLSNNSLTVSSFQQYSDSLYENYVVVDQNQRRKMIIDQIDQICKMHNLVLEQDDHLLEEVTGLVDYPFVYLCTIDAQFMKLPIEVLKVSMRVHQRYFSLKDQQGNLAPYFIVVANIPGDDGGIKIRTGNERVLRARLSDASFFYANDLETRFEDYANQLNELIVHKKLGSFQQKAARLKKIIDALKFEPSFTKNLNRIADLAKADLVTEMVNEFPELQGIMGSYYAENQGENPEVCQAIRDQYFVRDKLPKYDSGKIFALIDRLDTLVGFFRQGIQPTGSKDPFGLRRAAISVIQLLENEIQIYKVQRENKTKALLIIEDLIFISNEIYNESKLPSTESYIDFKKKLGKFFKERLKIHWLNKGYDDDQIKAVSSDNEDAISSGELDSLNLAKRRLDALKNFKTENVEDYKKLLTISRRVNNIALQNQESYNALKSKGAEHNQDISENAFELHLYNIWFSNIEEKLSNHNVYGNYAEFLNLLAQQADYIHDFFDKFLINTDNEIYRFNRLHYILSIDEQLRRFAKFDQLIT